LDSVRSMTTFLAYMGQYVRGESLPDDCVLRAGGDFDGETLSRYLAWYLLRNGVPVSTLLVVLRQLAGDAHKQCLGVPPPEGTLDEHGLDLGIKEVLHATGTRMTASLGSGWNVRSLNEILNSWNIT